jgi:hypothetical protein
MVMKFVALHLLKDSDIGEITPVILEYQVCGNLSHTTVASVFVQLTSIAVTPEMPIQVYLSGPHRGVPTNYHKLYSPDAEWIMGSCVEFVDFGGDQFDAVALANELDVQVFQPAQEAQIWVNSYRMPT